MVNLEMLNEYLPQFAETITLKRTGGKYNCPVCGSGFFLLTNSSFYGRIYLTRKNKKATAVSTYCCYV